MIINHHNGGLRAVSRNSSHSLGKRSIFSLSNLSHIYRVADSVRSVRSLIYIEVLHSHLTINNKLFACFLVDRSAVMTVDECKHFLAIQDSHGSNISAAIHIDVCCSISTASVHN